MLGHNEEHRLLRRNHHPHPLPCRPGFLYAQAETPVTPHAEAVTKCQGLLDRNGHAARRAASEAVGGCRDRSIVYSRFDLPRRCRPRWPAGQSTTVALSLVRIFCTAPSLSDAHRVHLNAHQVQFDGGVAIAAGYAPVEVDDVEIEWKHTSEYYADGKEIAPVGRRR